MRFGAVAWSSGDGADKLRTTQTNNGRRVPSLTRPLSFMAPSSQSSTARAIRYAFLANGGIAIAKSRAAWLTGSGSMPAEAIHSYTDTAARDINALESRFRDEVPNLIWCFMEPDVSY